VWRWRRLAEVEAYVDVAIMYAVVLSLTLLSLAILLPELLPR
jgi:hypothetical protein